MSKLFSLWRKELLSAFNSPIATGAILFFLIFTGVWFLWVGQFLSQNTASLRGYFGIFPVVFVILIPALTMRIWAEERKMGSQDLLLTLPIPVGHLVLGKFLGVLTVMMVMLALTLPMVFLVVGLGQFEFGEIVGEYIGIVLLGSAACALGIFLSGLSSNMITAFLTTLAALLVMAVGSGILSRLNVATQWVELMQFFTLDSRYDSFRKGIIDSKDAFYFIWFTALFLYLNTKVLILRKWR